MALCQCLHCYTPTPTHPHPQGYLREAAGFYESTLHYQPEFKPAAERLRIARCLVVMSKAQSERSSNHGNGTNATNSTNITRGPSQP